MVTMVFRRGNAKAAVNAVVKMIESKKNSHNTRVKGFVCGIKMELAKRILVSLCIFTRFVTNSILQGGAKIPTVFAGISKILILKVLVRILLFVLRPLMIRISNSK